MSQFKLLKKLNNGVRIGELETARGVIHTPFFMPVGTVGSVKGVSPRELEELGAEILLSNTYHLYLRPGEQLIKELGGLHQFMRWPHPILTDSGGYQVFSLGKNNFQLPISNFQSSNNFQNSNSLVRICDDGVEFKSHLDGSKHLFTPEKVIQIQLDLGVDILMPLDVCPSGKASPEEVRRATELTIKWAKRAKEYFDKQVSGFRIQDSEKKHPKPETRNLKPVAKGLHPLLHGIVQGGMDEDLRRECAKKLIDMDFDGYSVGGLAVDLETRDMWDIVKLMGEILPENKQRYLMGVGTPDDIIKATHLGMDMFDCVLPTRMARHGSVYRRKNQISNFELVNLTNSKYRTDPDPIDENCGCPACRHTPPPFKGEGWGEGGFSRAYISHLIRSKEILGIRLATLHNLWQYLNLMQELRQNH